MRRFLYYFPGLSGINPQVMEDRGVLDRFSTPGGGIREHVVTPVDAGPAGRGCIVAPGPEPATFTPLKQRWLEGDRFWVGVEGPPPQPEDLAREISIQGYSALLADGATWNIPTIHRWDERTSSHVANVPKVMQRTIEGGRPSVRFVIRPEYQAADEIAARSFEGFVGSQTISLDSLLSDAAALLAVNYRIGVEEVGLLGILDQTSALKVLELAIDLPAIRAHGERLSEDGVKYVEPTIAEE